MPQYPAYPDATDVLDNASLLVLQNSRTEEAFGRQLVKASALTQDGNFLVRKGGHPDQSTPAEVVNALAAGMTTAIRGPLLAGVLGPDIPDATDAASTMAGLNALLAALRTAGMIGTAPPPPVTPPPTGGGGSTGTAPGTLTLPFTATFTGTNGSAWDTSKWTTTSSSGGADYFSSGASMTGWGGSEAGEWTSDGTKLVKTTPTNGLGVLMWQQATTTDTQHLACQFYFIQNFGWSAEVIARMPDNDETVANHDGYGFAMDESGTWYLLRAVAGASTTLATGSITAPNGWTELAIEVETVGGNPVLRAYVNGSLVTTFTDTDAAKILTGKYGGIFTYGTSNAANFVLRDLGASVVTIQGNAGQMAPGGSFNANAIAISLLANVADVDFTGSFQHGTAAIPLYTEAWVRASPPLVSGTGYFMQTRDTSIKLFKRVAGQSSELGSIPWSMTTAKQRFRIHANGTRIRLKVWADGQTEPTAWGVNITDSSIASGTVALYTSNGSGTDTVTTTWDDISVVASTAIVDAPADGGGGGGPITPPPVTGNTGTLPTARSQCGPQISISSLQVDTRTSLPAGTYTRKNFVNGIAGLPQAGHYEFVECNMIFTPAANGTVPGRTVHMDHCSTFGAAENGGFANFTLDWCIAVGNHYGWRPAGLTSHFDISNYTNMTARSTIFVSEGAHTNFVHCEAVQELGGRGSTYTGCWFIAAPRFNSDGSTPNTAAYNGNLANGTWTSCGFAVMGVAGSAFYAAYFVGPNNNVNSCVVGGALNSSTGLPSSTRAMVGSDIFPVTGADRPYLNGVQVP